MTSDIRHEFSRLDGAVLLDPKQTGETIDTPPPTLKRWRYESKGPAWIVLEGRSIRYRVADIRAWLDRQTRLRRANTTTD